MRKMLKIILFLLGISNVFSLKCLVCETIENADCFGMEDNAKANFLQECQPDETKCVLLVDMRIFDNIKRKCMTADWKCESNFKCRNCTTDGCNKGTEIKDENTVVDIEEVSELLIANIYGIAAIGFLLCVLIIWCLIRMCSKKKEIYYDDDEVEEVCEDNFAVYYENQIKSTN